MMARVQSELSRICALVVASAFLAGCGSCQNCQAKLEAEKNVDLPDYSAGEIEPDKAYGVGATTALVQTFVADGSAVHDLELLVAEGEEAPDEPLVVEVRNERLDRRLGYGEIDDGDVSENLDWIAVEWQEKPSLEPDQDYAIVMYSESALGTWLIANGLNVYPFGEVFHSGHDTGFRMRFADGTVTDSLLRPSSGEVEPSSFPAEDKGRKDSVFNMSPNEYMRLPMTMCEGTRCGPLYSLVESQANATQAVSVTPKIARAQKFVAEGKGIEKFELLLIPPESETASDLVVEIRSVDLRIRHGHGVVKASEAKGYGWHEVEWEDAPELTADKFYSMVLTPKPTATGRWHIAVGHGYPWSDMRHWDRRLDPVDLGFRISFDGGKVINAGLKASGELPEVRGKAEHRKDEIILNEANGSGSLLPLCEGRRCVKPIRR